MESVGAMPPRRIVEVAVDVLTDKARRLQEALKALEAGGPGAGVMSPAASAKASVAAMRVDDDE